MRLVVGCPVSHREWILEHWFEHLARACEPLGVQPDFVFVVDVVADQDTVDMLSTFAPTATIIPDPGPQRTDNRRWNQPRYKQMVELRNLLLAGVRSIGPDLFLSLDSDVLLAADALTSLVETFASFDAVGGKMYMHPTDRVVSYAKLTRDNSLRRSDTTGVFPVDVIMGIKLMGPAAYNIDYRLHTHGEDPGWCIAARQAGLKLGWDGRVASKHVMDRDMLRRLDERVGF